MSRRRPGKKKSILLRLVLWCAALIFIVLAVGAIYSYSWVQSYIKSEDFRQMVARQLGRATQTRVTMEELKLTGPNVHVPAISLIPQKQSGWKKIEADRVEAMVEWNSLRDRVVDVPQINIDWASLQLRSNDEKIEDLPLDLDQQVETLAVPEWLRGWMPNRTKIGSIVTEEFDLVPPAPGGLEIQDLHLTANPMEYSENGTWQLTGKGGVLTLPGSKESLKFTHANALLDNDGLTLNDSVANWRGKSEITIRGSVPFSSKKPWNIEGYYRDVNMAELLPPALLTKLTGELQGDYKMNAAELKGHILVKNGVAQNMALLDRVAEFTRTDRFRRIIFDEAHADFVRHGETVDVTNLVLHSNDLLRVEGKVHVAGKNLRGELYIGVTTSSLRWIPGSQTHVFTQDRPGSPQGFVWTKVNLSGTVDDIKEDLSNRLLAAMGKALILDAPLGAAELGTDIIKGTGEGVLKGTGNAAEKVIETGTDLLKKVIPGL